MRAALRSSDPVLGGRHWVGCGGRGLCLLAHGRDQMFLILINVIRCSSILINVLWIASSA
jgi:hypothetical protein